MRISDWSSDVCSSDLRDQVSFAAVAIDEGRADAALQVESALFVAGTAAIENAGKNIQNPGGIGFSDEADPHLLLKRAQVLIAVAGGLAAANVRIETPKNEWCPISEESRVGTECVRTCSSWWS